jgi:four helix bundle protein
MGNYKNLNVWKISKDFAVSIYILTNKDLWLKDFGLRDQIRRTAVSIASNIAEGEASGTEKKLYSLFLYCPCISCRSIYSSNYCIRN